MNTSNVNRIIEGTPKKDAVNTVLKVLSAVLLVMNIIKLGKELTKKNQKKHDPRYR